MSKYKDLLKELEKYDSVKVSQFVKYCRDSENAKKNNYPKFPYFAKLSVKQLAHFFKIVDSKGLLFDGKHVTITPNGITFDYVAYKNLMLIAYPESKIDCDLVYQGDEFTLGKKSGKVEYIHKMKNVFSRTEDKIQGGYFVLKNKRGEFVTTLTKSEIDKHKKTAKTQYIWNGWYREMALKTLIKKACKFHFSDIYDEINHEDNKNNEPDLVVESKENIRLKKLLKEAATHEQKQQIKDRFEKAGFEAPEIFKAHGL